MDNLEAFELLRTIVRSAQLPIVDSFHRGTAAARRDVLAVGGGSRAVFPLSEVAIDHADKLLKFTWASLEPALDKLHLDWTPRTLSELKVQLREMLQPSIELLFTGVRVKQAAFPDVVDAAEKRIESAIKTHTQAVEAQLTLYVAERRRKEIQSVLAELEARLVNGEGGTLSLLGTVREARREAESSRPDDGRLRQWLDTLSTGIQGVNAAHDLGGKIQMLIDWFGQ